jgi:uncharacterized protein YdhG (YjbR/CyaY superfamily)
MKKAMDPYTTIDEYIAQFPDNVRRNLNAIRETIRRAAPDATEAIRYGIPTFRLDGNLVHFAAFKNHISFFPSSSGIEKFKNELAPFKISKGTVQFPHGKAIPLDLIEAITRFRVEESRKQ